MPLYRVQSRHWGSRYVEATNVATAAGKAKRSFEKEWRDQEGKKPTSRARRDMEITDVEFVAESVLR